MLRRFARKLTRVQAGRKRRTGILLGEAACVCAFLVCAGLILARTANEARRAQEQRAAGEALRQARAETEAAQTGEAPPPIIDKAARLLEENEDFAGIVAFGDMSLYVCRGSDNDYYARHRFDGSEDAAGMVYMDFRCPLWPPGDNTVLYGHNMRDGSRFGKLKRMTDRAYLRAYPTVTFMSLYETRAYAPISVFYASADPQSENFFHFAQTEFACEDAFNGYIREIRRRSLFDFLHAEVKYGAPLLTLATCSGACEGERLVVVCARISLASRTGSQTQTRTPRKLRGVRLRERGDQALSLQPSTSTSLCSTIALMATRAGFRYWRGSK